MKYEKTRSIWLIAILLLVVGSVQPSYGLVWIWDSTDQEWTTTLTDGGPIDTTNAKDAIDLLLAKIRSNAFASVDRVTVAGYKICR